MPFVWQTKFHKVSIQSIINIINLFNLGFGSESIKIFDFNNSGFVT